MATRTTTSKRATGGVPTPGLLATLRKQLPREQVEHVQRCWQMVEDGMPAVLMLTAAQRTKYWELNPPKALAAWSAPRQEMSSEARAVLMEIEAAKTYRKLVKKGVEKAEKAELRSARGVRVTLRQIVTELSEGRAQRVKRSWAQKVLTAADMRHETWKYAQVQADEVRAFLIEKLGGPRAPARGPSTTSSEGQASGPRSGADGEVSGRRRDRKPERKVRSRRASTSRSQPSRDVAPSDGGGSAAGQAKPRLVRRRR